MGGKVMVTVDLFKDSPFNNGSVMSNFTNYASQKAYFDKYDSAKKKTLTDVKISSLYEPIVLNLDLTDIYEYTYGRLIFGANKRIIYFSINRFEIVTENKTLLYFDIDYWETYRYSIDTNTNHLVLGKSFIRRSDKVFRGRKYRAYTPKYVNQLPLGRLEDKSNNTHYASIIIYHKDASNINYVCILRSKSYTDVIDPDYFATHIPDFTVNNVVGFWLSPFDIPLTFEPIYKSETNDFNIYRLTFSNVNSERNRSGNHNFQAKLTSNFYKNLPKQTEEFKLAVTDACGNLVWVNDDYTGDLRIKFYLGLTFTSARWFGYIYDNEPDTPENEPITTAGQYRLTIPCEPLDLFSDYYMQYYIQERPYLERERQIQKNQATINGLASIGTSAIGGAVAGSMVAPGPGTIAGAVGGAVSSLVGTAISHVSTDKFNKDYQENEDRHALMQTDDLRLNGSAISEFLSGWTYPAIVGLYSDQDSYNDYLDDIATFGYYYNSELPNIEDVLARYPEMKLTANCEVENVPSIAEQSVKARLSAGVKFIRPTNGVE